MEITKFLALLFLIYVSFFYLVEGQKTNLGFDPRNDCTKLYFFLYNDDRNNSGNTCCKESGITCDSEGYITKFNK